MVYYVGYLTIKRKEEFGLHRLGYPNEEVQSSMLMYLIGELAHEEPPRPKVLVGININSEQKTIDDWTTETVNRHINAKNTKD